MSHIKGTPKLYFCGTEINKFIELLIHSLLKERLTLNLVILKNLHIITDFATTAEVTRLNLYQFNCL